MISILGDELIIPNSDHLKVNNYNPFYSLTLQNLTKKICVLGIEIH